MIGMQQFSPMPKINATGIENNRDKKRPNRKLTKADISQPTNFKHLAHVGWNDGKRFELNSDEVNTLDSFLKRAGVSEQQLNDRDTRAYIYDFIQSHNVLDSVKSENEQQVEPPPVPTRNVSTKSHNFEEKNVNFKKYHLIIHVESNSANGTAASAKCWYIQTACTIAKKRTTGQATTYIRSTNSGTFLFVCLFVS